MTLGNRLVQRIFSVFIVFGLTLVPTLSAHAANLENASITLGDPRSSETSTYTLTADNYTTGTLIRCIEVNLNDAFDGSGLVPTGINTTLSSLDSSTLITAGSWTVDNTANGFLRITNAAGELPNASGTVVWGGVVNGTTEGTQYYGVVSTYTDTNCTAGPIDDKSLPFIFKDGEVVELVIDPTLTFTCSPVATGGDLQPNKDPGGDSTTVDSTALGIDFGETITTSVNGLSAHDLEVATNASIGYTIYIKHSQQLTNATSDTIANHTGTNAAPTTFPAPGNEAWGYTSDDSDLAQFGSQDYAGFTTTNEAVAFNSGATSGVETTRVGHQVGIAASTGPGTYQTTIIYTVVGSY